MTAPARVRTLRTGLRGVLLGALLVVALGLGSALIALTDVRDDTDTLVDRISPARIATAELGANYVDQQSGVRGYTLSRDESFLAPFDNGSRQALENAAEIEGLLADRPAVLASLAAVRQAAMTWRADFAEPTIDAVREAGRGAPVNELLGKVRFDALRAELTALDVTLTDERAAARDRAASGLDRLTVLTLLAGAAVLVVAVAIWLSLRRFILRPLEDLATSSRAVAAGDFDTPVLVEGPAEISRLGTDVESMRANLAGALAAAQSAQMQLREQATELEVQSENLRRSNEDLEQFAYVASHDLQEPLRKVASFCQMLQRRYGGELDERADQYIEFAVDGAKRMQQLIEDLLTFSRVGRTSEGLVPVETGEAARRALASLQRAVEESDAEVEIGELPTLPADQSLITQLFQNLIGNAMKFRAPDRRPSVSIRAERDGDFWRFCCEDNGIGIDPQYADRIFVIFQRLHTKDAYSGTGIGLSLCKKIVEYHGGTIWVDTDRPEGAGTTVYWTLPADLTADLPAQPDEPESAEPTEPTEPNQPAEPTEPTERVEEVAGR